MGDHCFAPRAACVALFFDTCFKELDLHKPPHGIRVGGQLLGVGVSFPRVMSLPIDIKGTLLRVGGAVWSVWPVARRGHRAARVLPLARSP